MNIVESTAAYEAWLRTELAGDLVEKDLEKKHDKMRQSAFAFLRATYWRWAEIVLEVCPELADAPQVLAVGDMHVENFGTWRDVDGRLVWGVNDFDDAAEMPFVLDLVRLAASAFLARGGRAALAPICNAILGGYEEGLRAPQPFVLDRDHRGMRETFVASEEQRAKFWARITGGNSAGEPRPRKRYLEALEAAMPDPGLPMQVRSRTAGTGSLGRPRWVAVAEWQGGPVVREAKAIVRSGWNRAQGRRGAKGTIDKLAHGRYRAPDPWYRLTGRNVLVRRLSPNSRKIEVADDSEVLLAKEMLTAMGRELANVHLGGAGGAKVIGRNSRSRGERWLVEAAKKAADAVEREFEEWRKHR